MKNEYNKLTFPQKAKLMRLYTGLFGRNRDSFYRRINGVIGLNRAEQNFFTEHLNLQQQ